MHDLPTQLLFLSDRQLSGRACVYCAKPLDEPDSPASVPVARSELGQMFQCVIPLAEVAASLEIKQGSDQPLSGVDLLHSFDMTIGYTQDAVSCEHAQHIRAGWRLAEAQMKQRQA